MRVIKIQKLIGKIGLPRLVVILMCGAVIIWLSTDGLWESSQKANNVTTKTVDIEVRSNSVEALENRLETALERIAGVGEVEVIITIKASNEVVVNKDVLLEEEQTEEQDSSGGSRINTLVKKEESTVLTSGNEPYIIKRLEPEINGVLIIAEGGGNIDIISELTAVAQALFDISVHKIKVMKMTK